MTPMTTPQQTITVHSSSARAHRVALVALCLVCVFWGSTFPLMKDAFAAARTQLDAVGAARGFIATKSDALYAPNAGPMVFLALRFIIASALMPLILLIDRKPGRRITKHAFAVSAALAAFFTGSFFLQVYGLEAVAPSVSAFVTSLFVVFTPFVVWIAMRKRPSWRLAVAVAIALAGVALISFSSVADGPGAEAANGNLLIGVVLSACCAAGFACHLTYTDYATRKFDPLIVSILMMVVSAVLTLACLPTVLPPAAWLPLAEKLLSDREFMQPLLITTVLATVVAVYAWNRWQKELGPSRAAVLYTMEPVFASIISITLGKEDFRWMLLAGACMVIGANIWCELRAIQASGTQPSEGKK
jgi:drug/metabolite transporter (DMT)-like permease